MEELVIGAVGFYNATIHSTTNMKPIDFLNRSDVAHRKITQYMSDKKKKTIDRINLGRGKVPNSDNRELYIKNSGAQRQKISNRFLKYTANNPYKVDLANIKIPFYLPFQRTAMLTILVLLLFWLAHALSLRSKLEESRPKRVTRYCRVSLST